MLNSLLLDPACQVWLTTFGVGLFAVALGLSGIFWPGVTRRSPFRMLAFTTLLILLSLAMQDLSRWTTSDNSPALSITLWAGLLLGGCLTLWTMAGQSRARYPLVLPTLLVFLGLGLATWSASRVLRYPEKQFDALVIEEEDALLKSRRFPAGAIQTGPPDVHYNCHGWTFTGGAANLIDTDVKAFMQQGNYRRVDRPQTGDIIVYLAEAGQIAHSGRVVYVSDDDLVLVESKWGYLGRYVHRPEVEGFPGTYVYYRAHRSSTVPSLTDALQSQGTE